MPSTDPLLQGNVLLDIDGVGVVANFTSVSGVNSEVEIVDNPFVNEQGKITIGKLPGKPKTPTVTLKRGLTGATELWDWHVAVMQGTPLLEESGDSVLLNTIYDNRGAGLRVMGSATGFEPVVYVENNIAVQNTGAGIALEGGWGGTAAHNDAWRNLAGDFQGAPLSSNLTENPLFCSAGQLDFRLAENSPCAPTSPQGQIGAFGIGCDPQVVAVSPSNTSQLAIGRVAPNPLVGGREVTVSFTLPGADPVTMEVLDASGRRVSSRDLGVSAAGSHRVQLRMEDLAPGIYWVRVAQAGQAAASKVSILP
jgi:parallel beta-helix repeat protein